MKSITRWLVYGFLAAVAAAVAAFPSSENESFRMVDPLTVAINDARTRFSVQSELLRREHSREIAQDLKQSAPPRAGGDAYEMAKSSDIPASFETLVRNAADAMFRNLPYRDSSVRVVIGMVLDTASFVAGAPVQRARSNASTDIFIPADASDHVCAIVVRMTDRREASARRLTLGADPCYWYKTYGMPGRGMRAMIDVLQGSILGDHGRRDLYYRVDSTFFRGLALFDVRVMGCLNGDIPSCERLAMEHPLEEWSVFEMLRTPGWVGYGRYYPSYLDVLPALLLSQFERDVGPARFRQLWISDAPFPAAFAQISGEPVGEWVHGVVASRTAQHTGPLPAPRGWLVLLIAIPSFLALGTWGVSRRSAVA